MSWPTMTRLIANGQTVDEASINAVLSDLVARTDYLKSALDAARLGEALIVRDAVLKSTVSVGDVVYWNSVNDQYELALADTQVGDSGLIALADSARPRGIVVSKSTEVAGDIQTFGPLSIEPSDVTDSGTVSPGVYVLSSVNAGKLRRSASPINIPVMIVDDDETAFVHIQYVDPFESHAHFQIKLQARPAGTANSPAEGETHEVSAPDTNIEGWLPADDPTFGGTAPACAAFGYNIGQSADLESLFPPVPASAASLVKDGIEINMGAGGQAIIDENGIWWVDDSYDNAPWDRGWDGGGSVAEAVDCEVDQAMQLVLFLTRMNYKTEAAVVTELHAADGSPITIVDQDDSEASRGKLFLGLNLALAASDTPSYGSQAVKGFSGSQYVVGPVMSKVRSLSPDLLVVTGSEATNDENYVSGAITLDVPGLASAGTFTTPVEISLHRISERQLVSGNLRLSYYGMPTSGDSALTLKLCLPPTGLPASPQFRLHLWWYPLVTGTVPSISGSKLVLAQPDAAGGAVTMSTTFTAFDLGLGDISGGFTAGNYYWTTSETVAVSPGATVFLGIQRAGDSDAYGGELGILRMGCSFESGA